MNKTTTAISAVTILILISKILGFGREMLIAAYYGATYQTDAYNMAVMIVGLATAIISAGIATVIIPMYSRKQIRQSKEEADLFISNILCITSLFYIILSVLGIIFAPVLVMIFAPSFAENTAALTINIVRIVFCFAVVSNITHFLHSIARIHGKFAITVVANYPFTIFAVISIIFFADKLGIYALVIAYVLFLLASAMLFILSVRKVFRFKPVLNFTNGELKEVVKLSLPIYLSVAVWEINVVVDRILASGLPEGSISAMNYAARLRDLPEGLIAASVMTVMFPLLSQYAAKNDFVNLKAAASKAISLLFMALLPIIAVSLYYATDITRIVYERGAFTPDDTALTARIFTFFVLSLIFTGVGNLLANAFYSMHDTKTPQIAAALTVVVNIVFNLILIRHMQAAGLALASSIAWFVYFTVLFILFRLKCGAFGGLSLIKNVAKCAIATTGMIPIFFLFEPLRDSLPHQGNILMFFFFAAASAVSLSVYALLLYLFKVDLFMEALNRTKEMISSKFTKNPS
ncbi:MAG: murein biosynthesis integral membrane protein MurJ [Defluviitaleaceae bacterium]|nr:murein biosynthesis integral membrane protein MurJ [Defluviitaleaceae bacterium]